jgi:hypothetical protein
MGGGGNRSGRAAAAVRARPVVVLPGGTGETGAGDGPFDRHAAAVDLAIHQVISTRLWWRLPLKYPPGDADTQPWD